MPALVRQIAHWLRDEEAACHNVIGDRASRHVWVPTGASVKVNQSNPRQDPSTLG